MGLGWLAGAGEASHGTLEPPQGTNVTTSGQTRRPQGWGKPDGGAKDPAAPGSQCWPESEVTVSVGGQKAARTPTLLLRVGDA